jgi:hypothetical protein
MEQVLVLAIGALPVKTGIVVSKRVASDQPCVGGIASSTRRTLPAGCCATSNTGHGNSTPCRLIGQTIGMCAEHLFPTSGT